MCTTCGCVRDLMECIRRQNYDLLITDLKMPQMNGFDVLKLLRTANVGNSRTIPVIAATASGGCNTADLHEAGVFGLPEKTVLRGGAAASLHGMPG